MTVKQTVEITNKLGMHARPAMKLFELMQGFDAEVLLRNDEGTEAEANSVIALLMLDSAKGRHPGTVVAVRKRQAGYSSPVRIFLVTPAYYEHQC